MTTDADALRVRVTGTVPTVFPWPESIGSLKHAFSIGSQPIPGGKRRGRFPTRNWLGAQFEKVSHHMTEVFVVVESRAQHMTEVFFC